EMANQLKMAQVQAILRLYQQGWSCRRIARELGVYRDTVRKHVSTWKKSQAKPANVTAGSDDQNQPKSEQVTAGSVVENRPKPVQVPSGSSGHKSKCDPFHEAILEKLEIGLSAQRIYQDLVVEHDFSGSYESVKRYVRKLGQSSPLPFRRMECAPGEECQVDFGKGAWVEESPGKRKRPWLFRVVLSFSRKGYSEVVWRQTTENFIRCLENAFFYFGGVPEKTVLDNLKAAVTKADWFDPELNPKIEEFARHCGTVFLPTKPYTPRHKGKVERGVGYAQGNALKGKTFKNLNEQNAYLLDWEKSVADTRIHGTTRKQVAKQFEGIERSALQAIPIERFPFFNEAQRKVHRDGHVEVEKSYYSVPPEYVGRSVWVRWDSRILRVFNHRFEQIALHCKVDPGRFSTLEAHLASEKISIVEKGAKYLLGRIHFIGPHTASWAKAMLEIRGVAGIRVLQGLLSLTNKYSAQQIEVACELALGHGTYRLKAIRNLIKTPIKQENFEFMECHPLIRDMAEYSQYIEVNFRRED
ncbi:IS21 family transposase, partial [Planctomycetota bacterium]